jgi:hypothetical protein
VRRKWRERALWARGLRPITIWVWDADSPAFRAEAQRQVERVRNGAAEREFSEI